MSGADVIGKTIAAPGFQVAPPPGFSGLQQAGDAIASYGEAMGKARDQSQLVDARLKYSTQLDDLYQGFMRDPDPATAPVRFAKAAQEASASYFDGLTSDEAKNAFNLDAGQLAESRRISLMDLSFKREGDQAVANVEAAGEKFARDAAYATNPAEREAAIASYTRSLMGTADAGFMTHDAAGKRLQTFKEKLSLFDGRVLIDQDPKLARTRLADPKFLPDLDPLARVELDGMAEAKIHQREREARADQAEARASAAAAIADYDSVVGSGLPVSPALTDQVKAAVRASGDPRLAARLENSMRAASFADGLRGASPREVEARLAAATNLAYATGAPMYTAGKPAGLVTQGNIDLSARPVVHNQDGTISTVRSITVQDGDHAVVLPTVSPDGKILSNQDAIKLYRQSGQHLGIFKNEAQATAYAKSLHEQQAAAYGAGGQVRGADPALAAAVVGGRKFLDRMNTQLGQDPLEFAAQQGVVRIQPLQLNGQDAPAAWQSRIRAADLTADHYGVQPHYLTAAEANQVKTNLAANADPAVRLATLQSLVKGLGSRAIPELNRLGASPALVTAGGLLTAGPAHARTAFDIVNGEAALAASSKGGDGQSALRPQPNARALATVGSSKFFGGVTLPQGMPQVMMATAMLPGEAERISAGADAYYAAHAPTQGLSGKDASTEGRELYFRGLQLAAGARFEGETQMGGVTHYRGRPVIAPAIVAADAFEGVVNHLTADDLAHASVSGAPPVDASGKKVADNFIRHAWLVTAGDGRYALSTTDPAGGAITPVRDAKGGVYRLNFPTALTILQARAAKGQK